MLWTIRSRWQLVRFLSQKYISVFVARADSGKPKKKKFHVILNNNLRSFDVFRLFWHYINRRSISDRWHHWCMWWLFNITRFYRSFNIWMITCWLFRLIDCITCRFIWRFLFANEVKWNWIGEIFVSLSMGIIIVSRIFSLTCWFCCWFWFGIWEEDGASIFNADECGFEPELFWSFLLSILISCCEFGSMIGIRFDSRLGVSVV